jgi:homoserine dehydrogenase
MHLRIGVVTGRPLRIGLIGLGTVGAQVASRLLDRRDVLARRAGVDLALYRVLVRDPSKDRIVDVPRELLTADPACLLDDPEVDVVVEMAGGEEPARTYLERALRNRKHVVTANKVVMAKHGPELLQLAGELNLDVYFEAAVGGGIPLISTFKVDLLANDIQR